MLEILINPPELDAVQYSDYFQMLISVSGVLFGLAFGGMLFLLQSGFSSFTFSRKMFLRLYLHFGRQILYALAYLTILPVFILYSPDSLKNSSSILYAVFSLLFFKATLDHASQHGYIVTLSSKKFVPASYGKLRAYFRYISNRGFVVNLIFLYPVFIVLAFPYLISYNQSKSIWLTTNSLFYSSILILGFCLLKITRFIPDFFRNTEIELESNHNKTSEPTDEEKQKNIKEKQHLKIFLIDRGIKEFDIDRSKPFIDGNLYIDFLDSNDNDEAWFNIKINVNNSNRDDIRNESLNYACKILSLIKESFNDLNSFVLSFHIRIRKSSPHSIFMRINRNEIKELFSIGKNCVDSIPNLKNCTMDDLLR